MYSFEWMQLVSLPAFLTIEDRMVLHCARVAREAGEKPFIMPAGYATIDWERVFALAKENRVLPLVYRTLSRCCSAPVPEDVLERMKKRCLRVCADNLRLVALLHEVFARFAEQGISVLAMKGPVFTASVYGDVGLRSYGDLDLLIARADLRRAIETLLAVGFHKDIELGQEQYEKLVATGHHAVLERNGDLVELHWELTGRYCPRGVEYGDVSARAVSVMVGGRGVPTLGADDALLYLCVHGSRHYWLQLDAVCCVNELLATSPDLDWDAVCRRAERWGAMHMLLLGVHLAGRLLDAAVPDRLARRFSQHGGLVAVSDWCIRSMFSPDPRHREDPRYADYVRYQRALMERKRDWLRLCAKPLLCPTHSDWQWLRPPADLAGLLMFVRPLRLAQKYGRHFLSRFKR